MRHASVLLLLVALAEPAPAAAQSCESGQVERCAAEARWFARPGPRRDPARVVALLRHGCDGGRAGDCADLATILRRGIDGLAAQPREALGLSLRLCEREEASACAGLARMVLSDEGGARTETRAARALEAACGRESEEACVALGAIHERGWGRRPNEARARAAYTRACEVGNLASCTRAAWMIERGRGGAREPDGAASRYERACRGGHVEGCGRLAELLETDQAARATEMHRRACAAGFARSCARLEAMQAATTAATSMASAAVAPAPAPVVTPAIAEAPAPAASACSPSAPEPCLAEGDAAWSASRWAAAATPLRVYCESGRSRRERASACHRAGTLLLEGRGVSADPAAGLGMLDQACSARIREACSSAGVALARGTSGVSADPRRARRLLERAGEDAEARYALALLNVQHGRGAERRHGLEQLATYCEDGRAEACGPAAEGYRSAPRGEARALALLEVGCQAGRAELCGALAGLHTDPAAVLSALERGCRLGHVDSCRQGAARVEVTDDASRARVAAMLGPVCEASDAAACLRAGELLMPVDASRAATLLARGCASDAAPCLASGRRLRAGEGGPRDREASGALLAAACAARSPEGCAELAAVCDEGALTACRELGALCEQGTAGACQALTRAPPGGDR